MSFDRAMMPEPIGFFEARGLPLVGRGKWRTTRCEFHGGSDSVRVNTATGGWICMSCGAKGGDVLAYAMQADGADFVAAAKALGAWIDDGRPAPKPRPFSAADALSCLAIELNVCLLVINDAKGGALPNNSDWARFIEAAGRIEAIAREAMR